MNLELKILDKLMDLKVEIYSNQISFLLNKKCEKLVKKFPNLKQEVKNSIKIQDATSLSENIGKKMFQVLDNIADKRRVKNTSLFNIHQLQSSSPSSEFFSKILNVFRKDGNNPVDVVKELQKEFNSKKILLSPRARCSSEQMKDLIEIGLEMIAIFERYLVSPN